MSSIQDQEHEEEAFWRLLMNLPLEAMKSPLYDLLSLTNLKKWREIEEENITGWIDTGIRSLPYVAQRLFAADCVKHVLPYYERQADADDTRARDCIAVAREISSFQAQFPDASPTRAPDFRRWKITQDLANHAAEIMNLRAGIATSRKDWREDISAAHVAKAAGWITASSDLEWCAIEACDRAADAAEVGHDRVVESILGYHTSYDNEFYSEERRWQWRRLLQYLRKEV